MTIPNLIICGANEVHKHRTHNITHILTIATPGDTVTRPTWFDGKHLALRFGDVISDDDARQYNTIAPSTTDISKAIEFTAQAWESPDSTILIHCDYGASRSPAVAYVALANKFGPGAEERALQIIEETRPEAVPNKMVVQLGDDLLCRNGALLAPLDKMFTALNAEISLLMQGVM